MDDRYLEKVAKELSLDPARARAALTLFNSGELVPFVARYRKDLTGNLKEEILEKLFQANAQYRSFVDQRTSIVAALQKQEKLTDELRQELENCIDSAALEDRYLPYKSRRRTTVEQAQSHGLEPLADRIWEQEPTDKTVEELAQDFVHPELDVDTPEKALEGARQILAERVSLAPEARALLRDYLLTQGKITSSSTKNAKERPTKYKAYYEFSEPIASIPSHRVLAIRRGVKDGFLRMDVVADDEFVLSALLGLYLKDPESVFAPPLRAAVEEAYLRVLKPYIQNEVLNYVRKRADTEAVDVFRKNAENILMAAPAGKVATLGLVLESPKKSAWALVDPEGAPAATGEIETETENELATRVSEIAQQHNAAAAVIGDKQSARTLAKALRELHRPEDGQRLVCVCPNEAPAAIYATSKTGELEHPEASVPARTAISLARRFQDPLAELVKIDSRAIGVGQYQHDANQKQLKEGLRHTVVSCISRVGVNLNTAPIWLLRCVCGIQYGAAQNIIAYRETHGPFKKLETLMEIDGIGPKVFEQCAGFLRLEDGDNLLDATRIHPDAYPVVEAAAAGLDVEVSGLLRNVELLQRVDWNQYRSDAVGPHTLKDIFNELRAPFRDPRPRFKAPKFLQGVRSVDDLQDGMNLEGAITNITDFGVFVDIGVDHDGLVHLSELANRFVRDPHDVVKIGDVVKVKVIKIEKDPSRISLSMKALQAPPKKRSNRRRPVHKDRSREQPAGAGEKNNTADSAPPGKSRVEVFQNRQSRAQKDDRTGKSPRHDRQRRKSADSRKAPSVHAVGSDERINTQLSEQLATLKKKLAGE